MNARDTVMGIDEIFRSYERQPTGDRWAAAECAGSQEPFGTGARKAAQESDMRCDWSGVNRSMQPSST